MTPLQAIKAKCLDCVCDQKQEVKLCPIVDCPLHQFRFGKNPNSKRTMRDKQKQAASERFKKMWEERKNEI